MDRLEENYEYVTGKIASACQQAGRSPDEVRLLAVTKTVGTDLINALYDLGQRDFGENRTRSGVPKVKELAESTPDAKWHFIGHLQRNKVKDALSTFTWIHSVDSPRLAREIQKVASARGMEVQVLIEIKTSEEDAKLGADPESLAVLLDTVLASKNLNLRGLMTMAPFFEEPEATRPYFEKLRNLREQLGSERGISLPELSMGMSNDYHIAIAEGATIVRVGTALFKGVES
ncbi:MAG: YggS family pyridoxal phosphate-dependent enzyme [Planctomycetes bacterium]|nr:YggS family pyridoxal phosphate-dependent enzyme [Planctomycetota bacterium]